MLEQLNKEIYNDKDNCHNFNWEIQDIEFKSLEKWDLNREERDPLLDYWIRNQNIESL